MIFNLIKLIFKKDIDCLLYDYAQELEKRRAEYKNNVDLLILQDFIGKPVIVVSNEWDTPVVGIGARIEYITLSNVPMLVVESYIDGKEYIAFGTVFAYTKQKMRAMFKLTPFELCSLIYYKTTYAVFDKEIRTDRMEYDEAVSNLTKNGFFEQINQNEVG